MGKITSISWTDSTVNFWYGCHHVSEGCDNCYADRITTCLWKRDFTKPWRNPKSFTEPLGWKEPRMIFTCSMSDFFLNEADSWREEAWKVIRNTPQHTWQILTKRPQRIKQCLPKDWHGGYRNVWLGVSIESRDHLDRLHALQDTNAWLRFTSFEPLLEDMGSLPLVGIGWVIVGGESGQNYRPMQEQWVRNIKRQCEYYNAAFFYKQPSGIRTELPAMLDGKEHKNWPKVSTGFGTTIQREVA